MGILSFRAEQRVDIRRLEQLLDAAGIGYLLEEALADYFPEIEVELNTDAPVSVIRQLAREVKDGKLILQTLRPCPLEHNTLERDESLV